VIVAGKFLKDKVYYSQNKEDLLLEAFFPNLKEGFYVDAGAYDPEYDSVTKLFYEKGWHGINIEPQLERYKEFEKSRSRDININSGVSNIKSELTLRIYKNGGLSTFSTELKKENTKSKDPKLSAFKDVKVPVTTLEDIFHKYKVGKINFLKVDVEGLEYKVLQGNNWEKYRPEVLCVESNNVQKDLKSFLLKKDYEHVFFDGLNDYYVDKHSDKVGAFDYVRHMVEKKSEWIRYSDYCAFNEITNNLDQIKADNDYLKASIKEKEKEIDHLNTILGNSRLLIRTLIKVILNKLTNKDKTKRH
jgi:FkbM family methyltransferase